MSLPFQPTTTGTHLISQGASVHIWEEASPHSHALITFPSAVGVNNWSSGGVKVTPLGKMAAQPLKAGLGCERKPMHLHGKSCGPQELEWVWEWGRQENEASGLQVVQPSPVRQWCLEDGTPRVGAPVTQF